MKTLRGFTIVELIVVIAVLGILLTLAVINIRGTLVQARDEERKTDVETISRHLESFYKNGYVALSGEAEPGDRYPSVDFLTNGGDELVFKVLSDIAPDALDAPGASTRSMIAATNNDETTSGVTPQPTVSQYVYQSIKDDGNLCQTAHICIRYNIFYRLESETGVQIIRSKYR